MRNHPGYSVEWTLDAADRINLLELLIKLELCKNKEFNFVQIGANDGEQADPLRELIQRYGLKGILVEPIPEIFNRLKDNYFLSSHLLQFENIAITAGEGEGSIPFYVFSSPDKERALKLSGFASTSHSKLQEIKLNCDIQEDVKEIYVPYESVPVFIKRTNVTSLSLLVTDVEGLDIDIVVKFLDSGVYPDIIYMEILGQHLEKTKLIHKILIENGYLIGGNISDLIAYRNHS